MNCQILLFGKNKENISLSSAGFFQRVAKANTGYIVGQIHSDQTVQVH